MSSKVKIATLLAAGLTALAAVAGVAWFFSASGRIARHVRTLRHGSYHEARAAAAALAEFGPPAIPAFVEARQDGPSRSMLIAVALSRIATSGPEGRKAVRRLLEHHELRIRLLAAGFWSPTDPESLHAIENGVRSNDHELRFEAATKVGSFDEALPTYKDAVAALVEHLDDGTVILSTYGVAPGDGPVPVSAIAIERLKKLTGLADRAAIEKWWASPETRKKSNAALLLEAQDRGAEIATGAESWNAEVRSKLADVLAKERANSQGR